MDGKVSYWMEMADYDFDTAKAMLATKRYLYVGFMCHQVVEKMLKAYWCHVLEENHLLRYMVCQGSPKKAGWIKKCRKRRLIS